MFELNNLRSVQGVKFLLEGAWSFSNDDGAGEQRKMA